MRGGGHMSGKYRGRGSSSSFRGSSYGYYDPYYNSSPIRGGRGGSRGRGISNSNGHFNGYAAPYPTYSNNSNANSHNNSGLTPTSSASGVSSGSISNNPGNGSVYNNTNPNTSSTFDNSNDNVANESTENIDKNESNILYGSSAGSSGSNEIGNNEEWENGYYDYNNEYNNRGRGGISPRFKGRGRGRGRGRGSWRGNRGGSNSTPYYSKNRSHYEYNSYYAIPSNAAAAGQYYYGREYHGDSEYKLGNTEMYETTNDYEFNDGYKNNSNVQNGNYRNSNVVNQKEEVKNFIPEKNQEVKAKAEELKQKEEHDHKMNLEFKEKHWIERIHATGDMKKVLSKQFDELDSINSKLLDTGIRRIELEIAVNRYNRILKAEDERVRIAEEKLESMNLSI